MRFALVVLGLLCVASASQNSIVGTWNTNLILGTILEAIIGPTGFFPTTIPCVIGFSRDGSVNFVAPGAFQSNPFQPQGYIDTPHIGSWEVVSRGNGYSVYEVRTTELLLGKSLEEQDFSYFGLGQFRSFPGTFAAGQAERELLFATVNVTGDTATWTSNTYAFGPLDTTYSSPLTIDLGEAGVVPQPPFDAYGTMNRMPTNGEPPFPWPPAKRDAKVDAAMKEFYQNKLKAKK